MGIRRFVMTLLIAALGLLTISAWADDLAKKNVVRERDGTTVEVHGISDGPDGFPTLKKDLPKKLPPVYPTGTPSTSPSTTPSVEDGSLDEEFITEGAQYSLLYDEPGLMACYSSVSECLDKMSSYCNSTYPLPPGSTAVALRRVTRYEEGRMCQFTCIDKYGEGHNVECTPPPVKRVPRPGDVTLTPTTEPLSPLEAR